MAGRYHLLSVAVVNRSINLGEEMAIDIIPVRFYGFDTAIYAFAALIGLAIAYKAYKLHGLTGKKQHFYLATAFTILGIGLATLTLTSGYTYYRYFMFGQISLFDQVFNIDDLGFWIYGLSSLVAYSFLAMSYIPESRARFAPLIFFTVSYFAYLNIMLFAIMAYVAFNAVRHWLDSRDTNSGLVAAGFLLMAGFHAALPFATFSKLLYVAGHFSLVLGFIALLIMLIRVGK